MSAQNVPTHARRPWHPGRWSAPVAFWALVAAICWHLGAPPRYQWPEPAPFQGDRWYNPYEGDLGEGLRTNLHAHGRSWGGLTDAAERDEVVAQRYRDLGYGLVALSNYQQLSPDTSVGTAGIPLFVYEHGFGLGQVHQTVVGAREVSWWDFPLWQGLRHKQSVIERLARNGALVFLNHPTKHDGYEVEDLRHLGAYHGLEIASSLRETVHGRAHWDAALSSGHPVWALCSDDYHGEEGEVPGQGYLRVHPTSADEAGVMEALRRGRFTSTWAPEGTEVARLLECSVRDGVLRVRFDRPVQDLHFLGQDGGWRTGREQVAAASYVLRPEDTYVRIEALQGTATTFLNPVFRHAGAPLSHPPAPRRAPWDSGMLLAGVLAPAAWWALRRRRQGSE